MSSVLIDDSFLQRLIIGFTEQTLFSLGAVHVVFHLEAFLVNNKKLIFLEIASRPGGAAIVPCVQSIYEVDLLKENFNVDVEVESMLKSNGFLGEDSNRPGGWVVLPLHEMSFCEVVSVDGSQSLPSNIVWKKIVNVGTRFNERYFEDPAVGMFVVSGANASEVVTSIQNIKEGFSIEVKKLG